jgi:3'-5' exoribonuclease
VRKLGDAEIDYSDFLPKTSKDIDQLWRTLGEFVGSIENPWLKRLIKDFMADDAIATAYRNAPAAKTMHHAYVGGLLDHVVSLMTTCDLVVRNYPQVNRDLLLTGAFLHDIGKIHELAYQRSISYTTRGQLLGHMIIELEMLHEKLSHIPGFPDELKILIEHLIISHHGQYEFGSPKLPMFPEALMLHYLDDLDSKMESMRAQFERESEQETAWTSYNASLARTLLNTKKFLEKAADASSPEAPAGAADTSGAPVETVASKPDPEADAVVEKPEPPSPLDALQRKFASHKIIPAGVKGS